MERMTLLDILTTYFNDSELRELCFGLDIDYENLVGQGKREKARELIAYCERYSHVRELEEAICNLRPNAFGSDVIHPSAREPLQRKTIRPVLVYSLVSPATILYLILLWATSKSLVWATIGYFTLGLSFGLLQSLFEVQRPYLVAFLSTALVPMSAFLISIVLSILSVVVVLSIDPYTITHSGGIPTTPTPFVQRLGYVAGFLLYSGVIAILVIPFGMTGVSGRFLGSQVLPNLTGQVLQGVQSRRKDSVLSMSTRRPIEQAKVSTAVILTAVGTSMVASILVLTLR